MGSLVSVIVPVYNVEEYLDECVASIVGQTYQNLEIILVDDGSPDSCPQKCDDWARRDSRIKVIHKENGGPGLARNAGLDCATGIYVSFVDSDDYLSNDAIENMLKLIEQDNSDMVVAKKVMVYSDGRQESSVHYDWKQNTVITRDEAMHMLGSTETPFPVAVWAKLYKKTLFDETRFLDLKTSEDTCIALYIIDRCQTISLSNTVVYYYFQRDTSIIHNWTKERQLDYIKAVLTVARFLMDRNYVKEAKHYYHGAICKLIEMKYDKAARKIITGAFSREERKMLRSSDRRAMATMLSRSFPRLYKIYQTIRGK